MSRDSRVYLDDILGACAKIERYAATLGPGVGLDQDEKTFDAVVRNLEVIGEAVKHLPDDELAKAPEVEWRKIAGLRDILAHAYFGVDSGIIQDVVANKLGPLKAAVERMLAG